MINQEKLTNLLKEIFTKKEKYSTKYNKLLTSFLEKASKLVELSKDLYQVEHTIKLNKISLKDYILNSDICIFLKENNLTDYSISELKRYMNSYEKNSLSNITSYKIALDLYTKLEEIEQVENKMINYELTEISSLLSSISAIKSISKNQYEDLYNKVISELKEQYIDKDLINSEDSNILLEILNDIFKFYLYGNKEIPLDLIK